MHDHSVPRMWAKRPERDRIQDVNLMGMYKYVKDIWRKPKMNLGPLWQQRLISWRRTAPVERIEKPTRIDRARNLGYKAKQGITLARVRVDRGGRVRATDRAGRKPKKAGFKVFNLAKSKQWLAEEKAQRRYPNMEVVNSYYVAEDGRYKWYEVILADPNHKSVKKDKDLNWITRPASRGRVFRGKTGAGQKSRALVRTKGRGAEKVRPSIRAGKKLAK